MHAKHNSVNREKRKEGGEGGDSALPHKVGLSHSGVAKAVSCYNRRVAESINNGRIGMRHEQVTASNTHKAVHAYPKPSLRATTTPPPIAVRVPTRLHAHLVVSHSGKVGLTIIQYNTHTAAAVAGNGGGLLHTAARHNNVCSLRGW